MATERRSSTIVTRVRQFGWGLLAVLVVAEAGMVFIVTRREDSADRSGEAAQVDRLDADAPSVAEPEDPRAAEPASPPGTATTVPTSPAVDPPAEGDESGAVTRRRTIFDAPGAGGGPAKPRTDAEQAEQAELERRLQEAIRDLQEPDEPAVETKEQDRPPPGAGADQLAEARERLAAAEAVLAEFKLENRRVADYVSLQNKISLYENNKGNERIAQRLKETQEDLEALGDVSDAEIAEYEAGLADVRREQQKARWALKALTDGR